MAPELKPIDIKFADKDRGRRLKVRVKLFPSSLSFSFSPVLSSPSYLHPSHPMPYTLPSRSCLLSYFPIWSLSSSSPPLLNEGPGYNPENFFSSKNQSRSWVLALSGRWINTEVHRYFAHRLKNFCRPIYYCLMSWYDKAFIYTQL